MKQAEIMTVRKFIRLLFGIPLLLIMILFALSNREPVQLGLFPTDFSIEVPLSVALLIAMGLGFFLGGLLVWFTALRHRREARHAAETVRVMEAKQQERRAIPAGPLLAPPR